MKENLTPNLNLTPQPFGIENGEYYSPAEKKVEMDAAEKAKD